MGKFKFIRPRGVWMFIDSHLHISPGFPDVRDRSFISSGGGGGGGGAGFLKNRVYENFTPPLPPPQKKNLSNKRFTPYGNDSWKILPHNPAHGWPGGWIVEKFQGTTLGYMREIASSLNLNWQEKQSEFRRNSSKGTYLRISLQCLDNNDVLLLLESILQSSKEGTQKINAARGLRAVQMHSMYGCGYKQRNNTMIASLSRRSARCKNMQSEI